MSYWSTILLIGLFIWCSTINCVYKIGSNIESTNKYRVYFYAYTFVYVFGLLLAVFTAYSKENEYPLIWWYFFYGLFAFFIAIVD